MLLLRSGASAVNVQEQKMTTEHELGLRRASVGEFDWKMQRRNTFDDLAAKYTPPPLSRAVFCSNRQR